MHKQIYASGFLYHPPTNQILLQSSILLPQPQPWSLFEGMGTIIEPAEIIFQKALTDILNLTVNMKDIFPIYTYENDAQRKQYALSYAIVANVSPFSPHNGMTFSWFSERQICKLSMNEQTKHDIIVGQRVISATERKRLGQHYFE